MEMFCHILSVAWALACWISSTVLVALHFLLLIWLHDFYSRRWLCIVNRFHFSTVPHKTWLAIDLRCVNVFIMRATAMKLSFINPANRCASHRRNDERCLPIFIFGCLFDQLNVCHVSPLSYTDSRTVSMGLLNKFDGNIGFVATSHIEANVVALNRCKLFGCDRFCYHKNHFRCFHFFFFFVLVYFENFFWWFSSIRWFSSIQFHCFVWLQSKLRSFVCLIFVLLFSFLSSRAFVCWCLYFSTRRLWMRVCVCVSFFASTNFFPLLFRFVFG